ncbi:S-adenosyl-L-methionine-dependent methyltransferase [Gigaspora margarita]|uniref:tRNA (adenine(58)-N(1))-methyltransferase catalytic subunit TRM61 n=1 Tax=Gigaspora margarita TaxID=4874 RepID=A0A8H3X511_GIGMA|nr:S-adenosyl-L-methionine-dependent methyltransferase [Gigaspora margarita]
MNYYLFLRYRFTSFSTISTITCRAFSEITSQKNGLRAKVLKKVSSKDLTSEVVTLPSLPQIPQKYNRAQFEEGDMVLLRDTQKRIKGSRVFLIGPLKIGNKKEIPGGILDHSNIIGKSVRDIVKTNKDKSYTIHFPTLDEYVVMIPRLMTPIYPKDANTIVALLDLHPYSQIMEAGTGNGSLTLYLARSLYPTGHLHSIDINRDASFKARENVTRFSRGLYSNCISFSIGQCSKILDSMDITPSIYDGVALDMPEPWNELPSIVQRLKIDRYIVCYLPNMTQVLELIKQIKYYKIALATEQVLEIQWRPWDVRATVIRDRMGDESFSVKQLTLNDEIPNQALGHICRPSHEPTGHTAFLVQLKKILHT